MTCEDEEAIGFIFRRHMQPDSAPQQMEVKWSLSMMLKWSPGQCIFVQVVEKLFSEEGGANLLERSSYARETPSPCMWSDAGRGQDSSWLESLTKIVFRLLELQLIRQLLNTQPPISMDVECCSVFSFKSATCVYFVFRSWWVSFLSWVGQGVSFNIINCNKLIVLQSHNPNYPIPSRYFDSIFLTSFMISFQLIKIIIRCSFQ